MAANYEGFWAVERQGAGWVPASLDDPDAALPQHIRDALDEHVSLVGEVGVFNICTCGTASWRVLRTLGPVDLFTEWLGERQPGANRFLVGSNLDEVAPRWRPSRSLVRPSSIRNEDWMHLSRTDRHRDRPSTDRIHGCRCDQGRVASSSFPGWPLKRCPHRKRNRILAIAFIGNCGVATAAGDNAYARNHPMRNGSCLASTHPPDRARLSRLDA